MENGLQVVERARRTRERGTIQVGELLTRYRLLTSREYEHFDVEFCSRVAGARKGQPLALVVVVGTHPAALASSSIDAARSSSIEVYVKLFSKKRYLLSMVGGSNGIAIPLIKYRFWNST